MRLATFLLALATVFGQQSAPPEKAGKGGIKVHGHWVMEIRNPDGSTASRKEFENSLTTGTNSGNGMLASLLTGAVTAGPWFVLISSGGPASYTLAESAGACTITSPPCQAGLTVTESNRQIVMQGTTAAMTVSFPITGVSTSMANCFPNASSPSACVTATGLPGGNFQFTQASVTGLTVQVGQMIAVTVTISFS
jgi:hypothetical protein